MLCTFKHFSGVQNCDIKVLILLYSQVRNAYLGFIPNEQNHFVDKIREEIRKQKMERSHELVRQPQGGVVVPGQGPSGTQLQQQPPVGMPQQVVTQQQTMTSTTNMAIPAVGVGPSTANMTMAGGTLTMATGKWHVFKFAAISSEITFTIPEQSRIFNPYQN